MNQAQVREIYLRVIDATIEGVRTEITEGEEKPDETILESLSLLKERWSTRLTHTHDFTDDPALIDKPPSSAKGGKKVIGKNPKKKGGSPKSPAKSPTSRNGVISVAALTNQGDETTGTTAPGSASTGGKDEPLLHRARDGKAEDEPPAKRPRHDIDDEPDHGGEDLDSSDDSDVNGGDSDEEAENLVLAQHDRVKKGPSSKWKVNLREGIVSIRGREYLFNRATCDLDF